MRPKFVHTHIMRTRTLIMCVMLAISAHATTNDSIAVLYADSLNILVAQQAKSKSHTTLRTLNPFLFKLMGPGTLYNSALSQQMRTDSAEMAQAIPLARPLPSLGDKTDRYLSLYDEANRQLGQTYAIAPTLFTSTEEELISNGRLRTDLVSSKVEEPVKLVDKVAEEKLLLEVEPVVPVVKRPNFWTIKGNGKLQFSQNYFSSNWYQGGEKNYSMVSQFNLDANFDNKQKQNWDNRFEAQLGFQTSETDQYHKFKATSNLLRLTSKLGFKAAKDWYYTAQLELQSQPYMSYDNNGNVTADFASPFYIRSSVGMDYKIKKKRFEGSLYMAPLSWNITYVDRESLFSRYGIDEGHHTKHDWGPNVKFTFTYKMFKNVSWQSRLYWFTTFKLTRIEWENTINFTINKYLATTVFLYPRFDDSSPKYRSESSESYWMFKEWLSLGLSYDF